MGNISEYLKSCAKNVPGNKATVYIQQVRYADSLTVSGTGGKITALTVASARRGGAGMGGCTVYMPTWGPMGKPQQPRATSELWPATEGQD